MSVEDARQGDVFDTNFDPITGHEQGGRRPALVISVDQLGTGPSGLAIVVPLTRTDRGLSLHVAIEPPEGGLKARSFALPEQVRSISRNRLTRRRGRVRDETLTQVLRRVHLLMRLP